ncbi:class I glutamine amidotransferase-like protein, partial [Polyplosphaeria fusca]
SAAMHFLVIPSLLSILPLILAVPVQPPFDNTTTLPINFAVLVFPGFQSLDVFGPLDVLNSLSLLYKPFNNVEMHVSVLSSTMDPVSTVTSPSARMNMSHGNFGESIMPTTTMKQVLAKYNDKENTDKGGEIDVLIVPGGMGTRDDRTEEIEFVKTVYPRVKYILSVCTGATILSRAGILDGRKATSNKRSWSWVISTGPNVDWIHTARWISDGNIWTSSGVSAGIDLTYGWVTHVYGEEVADFTAKSAEYVRWTNASYDPFAAIWS